MIVNSLARFESININVNRCSFSRVEFSIHEAMKFICDGEIFDHREKNFSQTKLIWDERKKKMFLFNEAKNWSFFALFSLHSTVFFPCFAVLRMRYRERQNQFCGYFFFNAEKSCGNYWSLIKDIKTIDSGEEEEEFKTCFDRCRLAVISLIVFPSDLVEARAREKIGKQHVAKFLRLLAK